LMSHLHLRQVQVLREGQSPTKQSHVQDVHCNGGFAI